MTVLSGESGKGDGLLNKPIEPEPWVTTRTSDDRELTCKKKNLLAIFEMTSGGERLLSLKEVEVVALGGAGDGCGLEFFYEYRSSAKCEAA